MDVGAAESAGATGILVMTDRTRPSEIKRSRLVCRDVLSAADWVLATRQDVSA